MGNSFDGRTMQRIGELASQLRGLTARKRALHHQGCDANPNIEFLVVTRCAHGLCR